MASQIRLRLTGNGGSGVCELMEQGGELKYRLSLEGEPGGSLEVLLQGRSPYMDKRHTLAKLESVQGRWQMEGDCSPLGVPGGWIWVLRSGSPWLVGIFSGVSTPTEAARRLVMAENGIRAHGEPKLLIPIPGLVLQAAAADGFSGKTPQGREFRAKYGLPGSDPFDGRGIYWAAEGQTGLWICWDNQ